MILATLELMVEQERRFLVGRLTIPTATHLLATVVILLSQVRLGKFI